MSQHAVLAAALCVLLATPGHAAVSATASLQFRPLTLLDLDPDDAIAPSLTWIGRSDGEKPVTDVRLTARASFDPLRVSYVDSYSEFFEYWSSDIVPTTGPGLAPASASMSSPDAVDPTQGTYMFAGGSTDTAANSVADAQFTLGPLGTTAGLTAYREGYRSAYLRPETVEASFEDSTAAEASGFLYAKVEVNGFRSVAAPVPEPQTWALLAGGLLTVTGMACGRRGQRRRD